MALRASHIVPSAERDLKASARRCFRTALQREEIGDYVGARDALSPWWAGIGTRPDVRDLDDETAAHIFFLSGKLASNLGYANGVEGAQDFAKDLIGESRTLFARLGDIDNAAQAVSEIAICYWRAGESHNAVVLLDEAVEMLDGRENDVKALALLRKAAVQSSSLQHRAALATLDGAALLFEKSERDSLKGLYHLNLATTLKNIGEAEHNPALFKRVRSKLLAAAVYFQAAGHRRYLAMVHNQLGFLLFKMGKYADADKHLLHARRLFSALKDYTHAAQVDDTRARLLHADGRIEEALVAAHAAVKAHMRGESHALLVEALTTLGFLQACAGAAASARISLDKAIELADLNCLREPKALAVVTLLEELPDALTLDEKIDYYRRATTPAHTFERLDTLNRLAACSQLIMASAVETLHGAESAAASAPCRPELRELLPGDVVDWEGVSLREKVRLLEHEWIARALNEADGEPTKAARMLGMPTAWSLTTVLKGRHRDLLPARTPERTRRKSLIKGH